MRYIDDPNDYMEVREESSDEEEGFGFGDLSSSDEEDTGTEAPSDGMGVIQEDKPSDKEVVKKKADLKKASLRYVCNYIGRFAGYVCNHTCPVLI